MESGREGGGWREGSREGGKRIECIYIYILTQPSTYKYVTVHVVLMLQIALTPITNVSVNT